jgi:hypothetical protein
MQASTSVRRPCAYLVDINSLHAPVDLLERALDLPRARPNGVCECMCVCMHIGVMKCVSVWGVETLPNVLFEWALPNVRLEWALPNVRLEWALPNVRLEWALPNVRLEWALPNVRLEWALPNVRLEWALPNVRLEWQGAARHSMLEHACSQRNCD